MESLGEVEHRSPIRKGVEGILCRQGADAGCERAGGPCGRNPSSDDTLPRVGLEPIDPARFVWKSFPDRQQQPRDDVDGRVRESRDARDLGTPGGREGLGINLLPMTFLHHAQRGMMLFHRPDQADAPLDFAIIEHERWRGHLHGCTP